MRSRLRCVPTRRPGPPSLGVLAGLLLERFLRNLAPLCRRHHRLKTHSPWTHLVLDPGRYLWTSPHGYRFLRDHTGTLDVTPDRPRPAAPPTPRAGPAEP